MYDISYNLKLMKSNDRDVAAHWLNHHFAEWLSKMQSRGNDNSSWKKMSWQGTSSGKETWIGYDDWTKAHFRDWAMTNEIPREYWEEIFDEFLRD